MRFDARHIGEVLQTVQENSADDLLAVTAALDAKVKVFISREEPR